MIYDTAINAENYLATRKTIYLPRYTRGGGGIITPKGVILSEKLQFTEALCGGNIYFAGDGASECGNSVRNYQIIIFVHFEG